MISINTNMPSLIAQRSLTNSTKLLNQAIERMTTGFKINHASDNAANYSITTNMSTKLSSYQVAEDNVAMGLDLLSTAGGNLDLITDKLTRLRALAEQAANGTYGESSLKAINVEANAIVDEIERIYSTTEYNGIKLFGETKPQFIEEVQKRDTSTMTKLSSVDPTKSLTSGIYSISTAEELAQLATMTSDGKVGENTEFVLTNDIDLSKFSTGEEWLPIGYDCSFKATFDGNGYVVSNLYIDDSILGWRGLFGYVEGATIKNLGVENVKISGSGSSGAGALAAWINNGSVSNCYSTGNIITDTGDTGGLIGGMDSTSISSCYSSVNVTTNYNPGGLIGNISQNCVVLNCFATGNVSAKHDCAGGFAGVSKDNNILKNCYSSGNVKSNGSLLGGFVPEIFNSTITNCYYNTDTSGQNDTGRGVGLTTTELNNLINNGTLVSVKETENLNMISFQVGIDSSSSSQISLNTAFNLKVSFLRGIGKGGNYLEQIDTLVSTVSSKQTEYGAAENRLESALEEIST